MLKRGMSEAIPSHPTVIQIKFYVLLTKRYNYATCTIIFTLIENSLPNMTYIGKVLTPVNTK